MENSAKPVVEEIFSAFGNKYIEKFVDTVWVYHGTQIIPAGVFEKNTV